MRLPRNLLESQFFVFSKVEELIDALDLNLDHPEREQIFSLSARGLPPIISRHSLALMLGVNPGFIWSLADRSHQYYNTFTIPKGKGTRTITAPRIALKIIQKWIGHHVARVVSVAPHVYGFVPGRSHIEAAYLHRRAEWALSVDIENFFQTTPAYLVTKSLVELGYSATAATLMTSLTCYNRALAQGAPSSSTLSNICFGEIDSKLAQLAKHYECRLTRYADDIVFSGRGSMPPSLRGELRSVFEGAPWKLAPEKERVQPIKGRIKVYGLLVNGATVRMTKGYRNKVAAYKHILETRGDNVDNPRALKGHVQYAQHVERKLRELEFRELHLVSDATEFR